VVKKNPTIFLEKKWTQHRKKLFSERLTVYSIQHPDFKRPLPDTSISAGGKIEETNWQSFPKGEKKQED
jgi:hypothetical protein